MSSQSSYGSAYARPRLDALTGVRGLAAWWVVFFHFREYLVPYVPSSALAVMAHGNLAVDLFFVLSGFVIYYTYAGHLGSRSEIRLFFIKRVARIYPLHLLTLLAYVGLSCSLRRTDHWMSAFLCSLSLRICFSCMDGVLSTR